MDKDKIIKMVVLLAAIVVIVSGLSKFLRRDSMSLSEYARLQGIQTSQTQEPSDSDTLSPSPNAEKNATDSSPLPEENKSDETDSSAATPSGSASESTPASPTPANTAAEPSGTASPAPEDNNTFSTPQPGAADTVPPLASSLTGASLNGNSQLEQRTSLEEGFYYEPLSAPLCRYITGVSYPASANAEDDSAPEITLDELRYVHILHYDFDGNATEGELICNEFIAQDLVEIFYELYRNEYQLEKVLLIDEYNGDDNASMEDNNTSCFNYRQVTGSSSLSKHALGLAVDINPLYNPYITYSDNGEENVLPASSSVYADRSASFPYKIDENDLCYKLFTQHGFTWGGNWNSMKDYQHFQKVKK